MNIIYEFTNLNVNISPLINGYENVITRVHYTYRATDVDSNIYADHEDFHNFELSTASTFKPFTELTPVDINTWLKASVDTLPMNIILERKLADNIASKYVRVKAPWEPVVEEIPNP